MEGARNLDLSVFYVICPMRKYILHSVKIATLNLVYPPSKGFFLFRIGSYELSFTLVIFKTHILTSQPFNQKKYKMIITKPFKCIFLT